MENPHHNIELVKMEPMYATWPAVETIFHQQGIQWNGSHDATHLDGNTIWRIRLDKDDPRAKGQNSRAETGADPHTRSPKLGREYGFPIYRERTRRRDRGRLPPTEWPIKRWEWRDCRR